MVWLICLALIFTAPFVVEALRPGMRRHPRSQAPGKFVKLPMGTTHYQWHGHTRGPVVVCVHGLTTPSFVWDGVVGGLTWLGFRVLTYDLYGRGYSARPSGAQNRAFFIQQLDDLLESQGIEDDITLIGYSMGGAIATAYAHQHRNRLRRLILIAPAGLGHDLGVLTRFATKIPLLGDWLMLTFFPRKFRAGAEAERDLPTSVAGIVDQQIAQLQWRGYVPAVLSSLRGILSEVQQADHEGLARTGIPVLAIWGELDETIPHSCMGTLAKWNRRAKHVSVPGAGHGLAYTHTKEVVEAIRANIFDAA